MSEKTPQSYIYLARPDLIKEWHPTKNGKSNPRNVTCDHAEEVWWLCENGHEWEATVKSRMVGDRCPLCVTGLEKEQSQKNGEYLQEQQFDNNNGYVFKETLGSIVSLQYNFFCVFHLCICYILDSSSAMCRRSNGDVIYNVPCLFL